jgi:hypothetical protein
MTQQLKTTPNYRGERDLDGQHEYQNIKKINVNIFNLKA